jgi:hypothetical protein
MIDTSIMDNAGSQRMGTVKDTNPQEILRIVAHPVKSVIRRSGRAIPAGRL